MLGNAHVVGRGPRYKVLRWRRPTPQATGRYRSGRGAEPSVTFLGMTAGEDRPVERVVGRYALYGEIASGGMATVHFGRLQGPVGFSRTVAIKRLHPQFAKDPEFVSMFLDEARLA